MRITELMVGDYVKDQKTNKCRRITGTNDLLFHDDYEPIPLTEEILVKNGFRIQVTDDNSRWLWVTDNSWLAYSKRHNYWYYEDMKIAYIHQLQHLLRLCGIEKEIEL